MSWLDQVKNNLIITCGDGTAYTPNWLNAQKQKEYNTAVFDFPNVAGTLVYRSVPKGRRYKLEIFFQGDDHLSISSDFETSADDPRPWVLQHPFYGQLTVQPVSIDFDNVAYNVTKITALLIETIDVNYPAGSTPPAQQITQNCADSNTTTANAYCNTVELNDTDCENMDDDNSYFQESALKIADSGSLSQIRAAFNQATSAINTAQSKLVLGQALFNSVTANILAPAQALQSMIQQPAFFNIALTARLALCNAWLNNTRQRVVNGNPTLNECLLYQLEGSSIVSTMCLAAANPIDGDYLYSIATLEIIAALLAAYEQLLADLDLIQGINGGQPGVFIPDGDTLNALNDLINLTLSNLFNIALNGQQQRSIILEQDSNWIVLTHRLYGLDAQDNNLLLLMNQNNVGLNTMLLVPVGTKIFYYI